jgi:NAD(P)H-flavin reductase/hemoglobin-like flavoprotein
VDVSRLRESFSQVARYGDELPLYFYSRLFLNYPETREMFPVSLAVQRDHLLEALKRIVAWADRPDDLTSFLKDLGVAHRRFEARPGHFEAVGSTLLATLEHFCGDGWTPEVASDWTDAYQLVASVMTGAMTEDEQENPAWWDAAILSSDWRSYDISVVHARVRQPLSWKAGQSVPVEVESRPRLWRYYSVACPPREDKILEFHVRIIDGGMVSLAFAALQPGAALRLGPPSGVLTLGAEDDRDLLMVAGSTGLAPLKAMLTELSRTRKQPHVSLFFGARNEDGLYDLPALRKLEAEHDWLTVIPLVSGASGIADAVAEGGSWSGHEAYIAGPAEMVRAVSGRLAVAGMPQDHVHVEDFGWGEPA